MKVNELVINKSIMEKEPNIEKKLNHNKQNSKELKNNFDIFLNRTISVC